jgi:outer membrane lipoprotein-sorting protein
MNFRIHYDDRETERILIGNEKYVWEYLPAANCALRTDLRHLSTREKLLKVGLATRLVHVPFLLIRPDTDLFRNLVVKSDTSAAGEPDILATADIPFMGETLNGNIRFGTEHLNVKNIVLTDETDTTIFHCSYSGYKKISGDIWWPQKVEYLLKTKSGDFKSVVEFESVLLNENYNDKLFRLGKIKGLKMKTRKATVVKGGGNR